jgi:hypothetical protein
MKKIWILLGIALLLFVFWGIQEKFGETQTIKKPPLTNEEVRRAKGLYTREWSWTWPILTDTEARTALEGFWPRWEAEQTRITMNQITEYADTLSPFEKKAEYVQLLRAYYIQQGQSVFAAGYQTILGTLGQGATGPTGTSGTSTTPPPASTGATGGVSPSGPTGAAATGATGTTASDSGFTRSRPGTGDENLRSTVATYAGIPVNDPLVNQMISQVQTFYDTVYVPSGKRMPTPDEVRSFVDAATTIPAQRRPALVSVIDYWFTEPVMPGDSRVEVSVPDPRLGSGGIGSGAGSFSQDGGLLQGGLGYDTKLWGPPFSGQGMPRYMGDGNGSGNGYPGLLGPPPPGPKLGKNNLPSSASLGTDPMSGFLPFSRQPGDQELIPDPYRVSQSYSSASYSSKNEPVPFLTDFSAFFK